MTYSLNLDSLAMLMDPTTHWSAAWYRILVDSCIMLGIRYNGILQSTTNTNDGFVNSINFYFVCNSGVICKRSMTILGVNYC